MFNLDSKIVQSIVLVDTHQLFKDGIKAHLEDRHDLKIIGDTCLVDKAIEMIDTLQPDIAVVDLFLGEESGIDILKHYTENICNTRIIALSTFNDPSYLDQCLEYEIHAFILKSDSAKELLTAFEKVAAGEFYLSHKITGKIVDRLVRRKSSETAPSDMKITKREIEVLNQIKIGLSTTQIAGRLHISRRTVETHRTNLFKKLIVKNSIELINKAKHLSIID